MSEQGLTASWSTTQEANQVTVTCRITHVLGHYEETSLSSAHDNSGGKNAIQAIGSAITYLQRYTLLALTGLATKDQDNDGAGVTACIDEKQLSTIVDYINEKRREKATETPTLDEAILQATRDAASERGFK